jgi:hypothetical protein
MTIQAVFLQYWHFCIWKFMDSGEFERWQLVKKFDRAVLTVLFHCSFPAGCSGTR